MRRREFIAGVAGAAGPSILWPLAARAQQTGKIPTVGFLGTTSQATGTPWVSAFVERMRALGWIEGRTVVIEYHWAEGRAERYDAIAADFVRRKVDVIVTAGTAVPALKRATSDIPIVFAIDADPVGRGLVASLARPGGNITGLSSQGTDAAGKRLALLREALPGLRQIAILANADFGGAIQERREAEAAARASGVETIAMDIRRADDIAPAFQGLKPGTDALYICGDALMNTNRLRVTTFALAARLPSISTNRDFVDVGAVMSYGPSFADLFRRAGDYTDKILRGAKPADLPIEQPTKFDLVVNLTTAKALGLNIPLTLLARADEIIE